MGYLHVSQIFTPVGNGSTEPFYAVLSNSDYVVVKVLNNIQGNLSLVNEYICYRLAKIFNMPVPDAGIGVIDKNTKLSENILIKEVNYGPCFFSKRISRATKLNQSIIKLLSNKQDFYRVLLFDHLVYNKDRSCSNVLVSIEKNNRAFYIIDHTHVFKNECIWDRFSLKQGMENSDFADTIILECNRTVYNYFAESMNIIENELLKICNEFKLKLNKNLLYSIMSKIPNEWNVSREDLDVLIDYLLYRFGHIEDICQVIISNLGG